MNRLVPAKRVALGFLDNEFMDLSARGGDIELFRMNGVLDAFDSRCVVGQPDAGTKHDKNTGGDNRDRLPLLVCDFLYDTTRLVDDDGLFADLFPAPKQELFSQIASGIHYPCVLC